MNNILEGNRTIQESKAKCQVPGPNAKSRCEVLGVKTEVRTANCEVQNKKSQKPFVSRQLSAVSQMSVASNQINLNNKIL